jgi:uncharacterized DUF497 family protein
LRFEWDRGKAARNLRKHGVSFEEGQTAIEAMPAVFDDLDHSEREPRLLAIGFSEKGRMLTVSFVRLTPALCRIISARKATRNEQEKYARAKDQGF